jgi:hypothetical protein
MRNHSVISRSMIFVAFFMSVTARGQDSLQTFKLVVKYDNQGVTKRKVSPSDTLDITFLYNYTSDVVELVTKNGKFSSGTLNADNLYGIGGHMNIPKSSLHGNVQILFNGQYAGSLKINRRYSLVHLEFNREARTFTWRYHKYRFSFL